MEEVHLARPCDAVEDDEAVILPVECDDPPWPSNLVSMGTRIVRGN